MQPYYFPLAVGPPSTMTLTTTLTDISGISVFLTAGGWYLVKGWIQFTTTGTSTTAGFSLGGTVGEVAPSAYTLTIRNNNSTDAANLQLSAAIPGVAQASGTLATAATYGATIDGLVVAGTSGTLTMMAKVGAPAASIPANSAAMLVQQIG